MPTSPSVLCCPVPCPALIKSREDQDAGPWGGSCRLVHPPLELFFPLPPTPSSRPLPQSLESKQLQALAQQGHVTWLWQGKHWQKSTGEFQGHACCPEDGRRWQGLPTCPGCGRKGFERPGSLTASWQQLLLNVLLCDKRNPHSPVATCFWLLPASWAAD